jgi:hypothetical protein
VTTNDPTPTISGISDVAADTVVRVTVGSQTLRALVQADGTWNIRAKTLVDDTYTVTASVSDPAGNETIDTQVLTVDTTAPALTITGGANALTNDATPEISGTAAVEPGTTVTVNLANETLIGLVGDGGAWSVTASALSDRTHRVIASVSDAAGNPASFTQMLTVDTVAPVVTINGGATAATNDLTPTITGTSDAAPGTTVTVSIAGQTMTTLVQASGSWNVTPSTVGEGTYSVVASVPDPAGNVGSATQTLTVDTTAPNTTITFGPEGQTSNNDPSFAFSSSEGSSIFQCRLDGPGAATGSFSPCLSPKAYTDLADGSYTFLVRATDPAGNIDQSPATRSFTVDTTDPGDTTAPETTINSGPSGQTSNNGPSFAFSSSEGGSSFECRLDGPGAAAGTFDPCTSSEAYTDLADGTYTFQVRAIDQVGNTDQTPATRSFTVDTTAPETTTTKEPRKTTTAGRVTFKFISSEEGSTFRCKVDKKRFRPCTSPKKFKVKRGKHVFKVRATDQAGNTDLTPAKYRFRVK